MKDAMKRTIRTPADFDFRSAVCSHGFFVLAPNNWDPAIGNLRTVVTLNDELAVNVSVCPSNRDVEIRASQSLSRNQSDQVCQAISRMLRLDENLTPFHRQCRSRPSHRQAAQTKFGRLLRSASLFEDVIKVICTCNTSWRQTVSMIEAIVHHWGVPAGDDRTKGFSTPDRLARVRPATLKKFARVGYRADCLHRFAKAVAQGDIVLEELQHPKRSSDQCYKKFRAIHGIGDYAASHLCMLIGHYDRLAIDTEMIRLLRTRYPRRKRTPAAIRNHYAPWHPYQYLAYWYELWNDYVARHGQSDLWAPAQMATTITSRHAMSADKHRNTKQ